MDFKYVNITQHNLHPTDGSHQTQTYYNELQNIDLQYI